MSEALRLADILEKMPLGECDEQAAAELRRLHAECEALKKEQVETLETAVNQAKTIKGLIDENEALRADAAENLAMYHRERETSEAFKLQCEELRAAIDAARSKT